MEEETVTDHKEAETDNQSERDARKEQEREEHPLPLMALNHVSRVCRSVKDSVDFYTKALGFVLIERPQSFDFEGAWLFNYGVGIHLMQSNEEQDDGLRNDQDQDLDPLDNHISFQVNFSKSSGNFRYSRFS